MLANIGSKLTALPWKKYLKATALFLLRRLHVPVVPLLMVLMAEALFRSNFRQTYEWYLKHPNEFAFNYWIAFFLTLLGYTAAYP